MHKVRVTAEDVAEGEPGTYSQALRVDDFLWMSGQIGADARGILISDDVEAQARQAFRNIRALVTAAGGTTDDIVKLVIYATDIDYRPAVVRVRREFFTGDFPCGTFVAITSLASGAKVEVDALAYLGPKRL